MKNSTQGQNPEHVNLNMGSPFKSDGRMAIPDISKSERPLYVSQPTQFSVRAQYLLVRSSRVRGMVKQHSRRSEIARFRIKMFLAVNKT